jgi:hypothetical protein
MSRISLPEGISPTNEKSVFSDDAEFTAPQTAIPEFSKACTPDPSKKPEMASVSHPRFKSKISDRFVREEDDDEDDKQNDEVNILHGPHTPGPLIILIAIGLVLAALAAFVLVSNQQPLPLCADQPDWNQYNCRAG